MAVIGNFLGVAARTRSIRRQPFEMRETEASFQAAVDPYARADFFMSFGESGVNLEEGFVTFSSLPGGLLVKAGKMRAAFGKVNTLHTHVLPWADRPLVTTNLVGGEEGINDAGVSVARLIPIRGLFLEATGQVFRGDSEGVFASRRRSDLSYVGHLRAYHDITENANIDARRLLRARALVLRRSGRGRRLDTTLVGIDATYRWKPLQRSIYRSFVGPVRGRSGTARRSLLGPSTGTRLLRVRATISSRAAGMLAGATTRPTARRICRCAIEAARRTLTFWPSEFSQVRGQYRRTVYAGADQVGERAARSSCSFRSAPTGRTRSRRCKHATQGIGGRTLVAAARWPRRRRTPRAS